MCILFKTFSQTFKVTYLIVIYLFRLSVFNIWTLLDSIFPTYHLVMHTQLFYLRRLHCYNCY